METAVNIFTVATLIGNENFQIIFFFMAHGYIRIRKAIIDISNLI